MKLHREFTLPYSMSFFVAVIATSLLSGTSAAQPTYRFDWQRQFGTAYVDGLADIAVDKFGNAFVSGHSQGAFGGTAQAFLRKYNAAGNEIWTRQYGIVQSDNFGLSFASGVASDADGNAYVAGTYNSTVDDCCNFDPYLRKYDQNGDVLWTKFLSSDSSEETARVAADTLGNIFMAGSRSEYPGSTIQGFTDAYLAKYDAAGDLIWHRQFGGSGEDQIFDVSADGLGNVFLAGYQEVRGSMGGSYDAYVSKFDSAGNELWTTLLGGELSFELAFGVDVSTDGRIYLAGQTDADFGSPPVPSPNRPFVAELDDQGVLQWVQTLEVAGGDGRATDVSVDDSGVIHVAGYLTTSGGTDAFLEKFSGGGESLGRETLGAAQYAALSAIETHGQFVYAVGGTTDSLFAPAFGESDAIVMRFTSIPEPGNTWLLACAAGAVVRLRSRVLLLHRRSSHSPRLPAPDS